MTFSSGNELVTLVVGLNAQLFKCLGIFEHRLELGMLGRFVVHGCQELAALHGNLQVDATVRQIVFPQHGVFGGGVVIRTKSVRSTGMDSGMISGGRNCRRISVQAFSKTRFQSTTTAL